MTSKQQEAASNGDDQTTTRPRVLSLLSAATEIVCRLGCSHLLVGRSHGCDDPPLITSLPVATAPRVDPNAPSAALDAQVRVQSASGGPIYQINNHLVTSANPTVIITQEQCRICAVTPDDLNQACQNLPPTAKLITIMPVSLDDVFGDVITISNALGVHERGERLVKHIKKQLADLNTTTLSVLGNNPKPKVAHVEWLAPLMGSGYWIAECVAFAGGEMVHGYPGGHSQTLEKIELLSNADYIILGPCGFSIERTNEELNAIKLLESEEWQSLPAVKNGRVAIADGNKYFNRSSVASMLGSAEIVAEFIHSELRGMYGHHGTRWVRLEELSAFCSRTGAEAARKEVVLAEGVVESPNNVVEQNGLKQESSPEHSETVKHVSNQIAALTRSDYASAFAMNSAANQKRLVSAEKFEAIVSGWPSFKVLTLSSTSCQYFEGTSDGSTTSSVKVDAMPDDSDEVLHFVFDIRQSEDGKRWETDGVRIDC